MIYGIDISPYQGNISDLGSDIDFVIIKVTQGASNVSANWQEQRDKARADGKIVIYYHFIDDINNAVAETQHFLSSVTGRWAGEGAAVDWEVGNYSDAVDASCATFFDMVKQAWGVNSFPYSNAARINSGSWPRMVERHAPLWEAAYASSPPSPSPFPIIAIWQYTSSGSETGVSGAVDKDEFNGTRDQLKQVIGGGIMYPNSGDLTNINKSTGWPGHAPNANDLAYWTTGTGNNDWSKGADQVWKDLLYQVIQYVLANDTGSVTKQSVENYINQHLT